MANNSRDQCLIAAMSAVERCSQRVAQFLEGEQQVQAMDKLYSVVESFCMLEEKAAATDSSLHDAKLAFENEEDDEMTFQQAFDQQMEQRMGEVTDLKKHPKYIKFDKNVKVILAEANNDGVEAPVGGSDDDEELMVTEAEVNTIDPISQQVMVSPVKNKICGHAYEKDSILTMLKTKKRMRCPYVGCPNRGHFGASDLEEDTRLKQILKRQRTK